MSEQETVRRLRASHEAAYKTYMEALEVWEIAWVALDRALRYGIQRSDYEDGG